ncbi:MAG: SDR family NAD(P)-dependent oxidoreductase [Solirubrobacterales bacterium]
MEPSESGSPQGRPGALVTGAGRGLGREIALMLAARGHGVHVTDVDLDTARAVAEEIGEPAFASALDVSDNEACRAAANATAERFGSLEVWVNNAGILPLGNAWDQTEEQIRKVFEVNAFGTINGTLAALELMRPAGKGHVLNVVSLAGLIAAPGENVYSSTKHAALSFSVGTQIDLKLAGLGQIRVSALCPDGIWTPMLFDKADDPRAAASWSGKFLQPAEVAAAAGRILDRPRPVTTIPRWRGPVLRLLAAFPGLTLPLSPMIMADARRRQKAWKKKNLPPAR